MKANFEYIEGIPGWPAASKLYVTAEIYDDRVLFTKKDINDGQVVTLMIDSITEVHNYTQKEVKEYKRSPIGRALVGSLFGSTGAMIGAISGTKNTVVEREDNFYRISYISQDGIPSQIILRAMYWDLRHVDFSLELRRRIPKREQKDDSGNPWDGFTL